MILLLLYFDRFLCPLDADNFSTKAFFDIRPPRLELTTELSLNCEKNKQFSFFWNSKFLRQFQIFDAKQRNSAEFPLKFVVHFTYHSVTGYAPTLEA